LPVTATDSAAEPPAAEAFYDARRGVYYTKPALRGWLHLLWFEVSLVFGTLLLVRAHGATRIAASAIYAASVCGMFGISALYHRGIWSAGWRQRLQRLDHAMIFFLIAGTATPALLLAVRGTFGLVCLIVMWALTATAAAVRMARMSTPELVAGAMFVGLGWLAGLALPWVWVHAGVAPALLMLAGGLLARPHPVRVRLSRGLSRLCLRRRDVPVRRDRSVHHLSRRDEQITTVTVLISSGLLVKVA
jgi:hemolysin III